MDTSFLCSKGRRVSQEEYECYICVDNNQLDDLRLDLCECKERAMHLSCQKRMIEANEHKDGRCRVCGQPYVNISFKRQVEYDWTRIGVICAHIALFMLTSLLTMYCMFIFLGLDQPRASCFCDSGDSSKVLIIAPRVDTNASRSNLCKNWMKNSHLRCVSSAPNTVTVSLLFGGMIWVTCTFMYKRLRRYGNLRRVGHLVVVSDVSSDTQTPDAASVDEAYG